MASPDKKEIEAFLDSVISKLIGGNKKGENLRAFEINRLTKLAVESFMKQETLISTEPPITVVGDIHGQYRDLLALLEAGKRPPETRYLFLGDYVDRGSRSIEVICLLLALKVRYPNDVYLLRGNHESRCINRSYGFYNECTDRYSLPIWHVFQECFNVIPLCAIIGERIFCAHGGLPRHLRSFDDIRRIKRPLEIPDEGTVCDLLWSDPNKSTQGWEENSERGVSHMFGEDAVLQFCKHFDIDLVVRAHQVVDEGYELFANGHLITIFSAPNYTGLYRNAAALLEIDVQLLCRVRVLRSLREKPPEDDVASVEESAVETPGGTGAVSQPLWMRRALEQMQQLFEAESYSLYHPGQPDPPRKWWRTTMSAGESHLSYRSVSAAPIELTVALRGTPQNSLFFKAHVVGSSTSFEYTMHSRPEYEAQPVSHLKEIVRDEINDNLFRKVYEAAKSAQSRSHGTGLRSTVNWFSSWLHSGSDSQEGDSGKKPDDGVGK